MTLSFYRDRAKELPPLGDLKESIEEYLHPNHDRLADVEVIRQYIEDVCDNDIPRLIGCRLILFGSRKSNVMTEGSDADLCLLLPVDRKMDDVDVS